MIEVTKINDKGDKGHWFVSNAYVWGTAPTMQEALNKVIKETGSVDVEIMTNVVYVPVPQSDHYSIEWYLPQVEGCMVIQENMSYRPTHKKKTH